MLIPEVYLSLHRRDGKRYRRLTVGGDAVSEADDEDCSKVR